MAAGASVRSQVMRAHRWRWPRIRFALRQACQRSPSSGFAQMFRIICERLAGAVPSHHKNEASTHAVAGSSKTLEEKLVANVIVRNLSRPQHPPFISRADLRPKLSTRLECMQCKSDNRLALPTSAAMASVLSSWRCAAASSTIVAVVLRAIWA